MLVLVCIVQLWIRFCFTFPLNARRGLNRQNCPWQNSAQCLSLLDLQKIKMSTPRSVSQFWIFNFFRNIIIWILNSLEMKTFKNLKNLFDSAQC